MNTMDRAIARHRLEGIAGEMGNVLTRTAFSPNIREREDLSCAITDPEGNLVAQAAHIPVHLGAIPEIMNGLLEEVSPEPDVGYLTNDPFTGGTHLPDITYVLPWYREGSLAGWVVNRAHHADVGGEAAGSMAQSTTIHEEGLRIEPREIWIDGTLQRDRIGDLLAQSRSPKTRLRDLEAQAAAAQRGIRRLDSWASSSGLVPCEVFNQLREYGARYLRSVLEGAPNGEFQAMVTMDDDGQENTDIRLSLTGEFKHQSLRLDYRETEDQVAGNINCPRSVTVSASLYVLRCLLDGDVPVNQGLLDPVEIKTRKGSLLDAQYPAAVAAGNVETSQQIVDLLYKGLGEVLPERIPAASQGTMNNVTLGWTEDGEERSYYETLGGGAGAGPDGPGLATRQTHMTNTRNTPIEEFERQTPMLVTRLQVRDGSGGAGLHAGGEGLVKRWRTREAVELGLVTERRRTRPYGLHGGEPGEAGNNRLRPTNNHSWKSLPSKVVVELEPGDEVEVQTPGGGGWGTGSNETKST